MNEKRKSIIKVFIVSILIALILAPFASSSPDGLEKVAEDLQFINIAKENMYEIIPDYSIKGINNQILTTAISGILGVMITLLVVMGSSRLIKRK